MAWKKNEGTKHNADCNRAFKNYDARCPRCLELKNGMPAREGWGDWKRSQDARQLEAIKSHDCKSSNCMVVCTFGDW